MKREIYTDDFAVGQPKDIPLNQGAGVNLIGAQAIVTAAIDPLNKNYLDELAFMEEPIEIMVAETTDENAENPVQVGVNGVFILLERGKPTICKRKFADALIVKGSKVTTPEIFNPAGERSRAIRQTSALKYPFTIVRDDNPRSREWLQRRMADIV